LGSFEAQALLQLVLADRGCSEGLEVGLLLSLLEGCSYASFGDVASLVHPGWRLSIVMFQVAVGLCLPLAFIG